jgi:hypothetical protein
MGAFRVRCPVRDGAAAYCFLCFSRAITYTIRTGQRTRKAPVEAALYSLTQNSFNLSIQVLKLVFINFALL